MDSSRHQLQQSEQGMFFVHCPKPLILLLKKFIICIIFQYRRAHFKVFTFYFVGLQDAFCIYGKQFPRYEYSESFSFSMPVYQVFVCRQNICYIEGFFARPDGDDELHQVLHHAPGLVGEPRPHHGQEAQLPGGNKYIHVKYFLGSPVRLNFLCVKYFTL